MNALRQQFLAALKAPGKVLIAKSANAPEVIAVRNGLGEVIGFGRPEAVSPEEVQAMLIQTDPNACFDDSALCPYASRGEVVHKSASTGIEANAIFDSCFPF
jgi:hypothetical protein